MDKPVHFHIVSLHKGERIGVDQYLIKNRKDLNPFLESVNHDIVNKVVVEKFFCIEIGAK